MAKPCGCGKSTQTPEQKATVADLKASREAYRAKLAELAAQPSPK